MKKVFSMMLMVVILPLTMSMTDGLDDLVFDPADVTGIEETIIETDPDGLWTTTMRCTFYTVSDTYIDEEDGMTTIQQCYRRCTYQRRFMGIQVGPDYGEFTRSNRCPN